jgi:hypothetical protein
MWKQSSHASAAYKAEVSTDQVIAAFSRTRLTKAAAASIITFLFSFFFSITTLPQH